MTFEKGKLCQFLFFRCGIIFDKSSKLWQISCEIPYYIKIKDSLYLDKFFVNLLENEKGYSLTLKFYEHVVLVE